MGKTIVAGGAGFLPSHMCDRLIAEGHEVVALDNFITGRTANVTQLSNEPHFDLIEQDVSQPFEISGDVDYVLHLASPASPADFFKYPLEIMRVGSMGSHNLLELARNKNARYLFASTSEVYGDPPPEHHPQVESYWGNVSSIGTRSVYDEAKRYGEAATMAYHREFGLSTRIIRIFNTYGPRMHADDGRVVTNFVCQALRDDPLTIYGDGTQTRSFTYVSDMVEGMFRLLMSEESFPVNIGNPVERTVTDFAERVVELTESNSELSYQPLPTEDDPKQRCPDITRARECLGWEPTVQLEEGLRHTIAHMRQELGL